MCSMQVYCITCLVQESHGGWGGWNDIVYKEEESVLGSQVDSFPDEEVKLAHWIKEMWEKQRLKHEAINERHI